MSGKVVFVIATWCLMLPMIVVVVNLIPKSNRDGKFLPFSVVVVSAVLSMALVLCIAVAAKFLTGA